MSGKTELVNDLKSHGYRCIAGAKIGPGGDVNWKQEDYSRSVLETVLENSLKCLNPHAPAEARRQAADEVLRFHSWDLITRNECFHKMLVDGVAVEYLQFDEKKRKNLRLMDFDNPANNRYLAVTDFTVREGEHREQLDLVLFVNGLPLVVIAFAHKPHDGAPGKLENSNLRPVYQRLNILKNRFPSFFRYNALLAVTNGYNARVGSLTAGYNRFMVWRTHQSGFIAPISINQLKTLTIGMLSRAVLPDMIKHFIVFTRTRKQDPHSGRVLFAIEKKIAAYHQYYAVNLAVDATTRAVSLSGDQRCGVVWHTQGSGKSMTMMFYTAKLTSLPELENPTVVVITDRNDLEDQLFETFATSLQLLRQPPIQVEHRSHLKQLLKTNSGGILFTTVQKFFPGKGKTHPLLSTRRNIFVIADEAHRSQYDFIDGFARHMRDALPNASFIGFTGTPLEREDRNTRAVFGDYIHIYDVRKAVEDGVTVPIYYESRLVDVELDQREHGLLDTRFEEITRDRAPSVKKKLENRWARIEAVIGSEQRIRLVARDIVSHFEQRQAFLPGKAMVVAVSREVCIRLYREIVSLRPRWHSPDDSEGLLKVVVTGTSLDPAQWQPHIRDKTRRRVIGDRLKDPANPLKMVIVCDMWLTGFDVPCLHTLYIDKPLKGHHLMQAIARVNRVFHGKPGGLVVDYIGVAPQLEKALSIYIDSGGMGKTHHRLDDVVVLLEEKYEVVTELLHGFSYKHYFKAGHAGKECILLSCREYLSAQGNREGVFVKEVSLLSRAFASSVPHPAALRLKDELAFFQAVRGRLNAPKSLISGSASPNTAYASDAAVETAVEQIVSRAIVTRDIADIFEAGGIEKPGVSILSEAFFAKLGTYPSSHAAEILSNLLEREISTRARKNLIWGRSFRQSLDSALRSYRARHTDALKVLEALIRLAREIRLSDARGGQLDLSADEVAIYDVLVSHDNVFHVIPEKTVKIMARELVRKVRKNAT
ncbi:MAG: type I restriction endonuclease subunit R, partial [bacterium]|nr:type I restriction endonuclease subunit R [bacterium]